MAHDDRRDAAAGGAVVSVDVAAADAAGSDADEHFVRRGGRRGEIGEFEIAVAGEEESFHRQFSLQSSVNGDRLVHFDASVADASESIIRMGRARNLWSERPGTRRFGWGTPLPLFFVSVDSTGVRERGLVSVESKGS